MTDLPGRGGDRRGPDFGERRAPRESQFNDDGKVRDFSNWERRGPLSPLSPAERPESREGSRPRTNDGRSESFRGGARRASPAAWGPGEPRQEGSRPPRREFSDRPERVPTAAEKESNWRSLMRPDAPAKSPSQSHEGTEAPPSPAAPAAAQPAGRPKLNLAKRTVSEATDAAPTSTSVNTSKPSPFGAARPIDTTAREREIEERRLREKKEAEERAKEEKRAREAAAKEAAEKAAAEEAAKANGEAAAPEDEAKAAAPEGSVNGSTEQKIPIRSREARENPAAPKSRAVESGNWRQASGDRAPSRGAHVPSGPRRGGPPRGPRSDAGRPARSNGNGSVPQQPQSPSVEQSPSTPTVDEDGWTMVPNKSRRGQSNRPIAP